MHQLKLSEPYDQVFVGVRVENPLTGESTIVDAKIDTGAAVTVIPFHMLDGLGLEILGEHQLSMANGDPLPATVCLCNLSLSDDDILEMPIYAIQSFANIALIGMDILHQCNFSYWHEFNDGKHTINFKIELYDIDE